MAPVWYTFRPTPTSHTPQQMRNLFLALTVALTLSACVTPSVGKVDLTPGTAFRSTADAVVERTVDASAQDASAYLDARTGLTPAQEVSDALSPTFDAHDDQVAHDPELELFEVEIYLGDTQALRDLLAVRGAK